MPEYLAPGVYVEETSFRAKSIEGVGTSTTAFVGPTRKGPFRADTNDQEVPELLTSYGDFERIYGGIADFGFSPATNYLAHAVRAFFNEGGSRLYVSRVVGSGAATAAGAVTAEGTAADEAVAFVARFPGAIGNGRIVVREVLAPVALTAMNNAPAGSLLLTGSGAAAAWHLKIGDTWHPAGSPADVAEDAATLAAATPRMATLLVVAIDGDGEDLSHEGLGFDRSHPAWVGHVMAAAPGRRADHLQNLYAIAIGGNVGALELRNALFAGAGVNAAGELERSFALTGGSDGAAPGTDAYALALGELAGLEDVSIVAAPGSSAYPDAQAVANLLISHAEARRAYRIAVLDLPPHSCRGTRARCAASSTRATPRSITPGSSCRIRSPARGARTSRASWRCRPRASCAASTPATTSSAGCGRRPPTRSCAGRCASSSTSTSPSRRCSTRSA